MKELLEKVRPYVESLVNENQMILDRFDFERRGGEWYLVVYVEKEEGTATLDEVCLISDRISKKLDEIDLIPQNYVLDVSTSGAEKPIRDFRQFGKYVGKYISVKLRNPVEGLNAYTGTLEQADETTIRMSYKVKTRTRYVDIETENITKANLAVQF